MKNNSNTANLIICEYNKFSVPLAMGLSIGNTALSTAVLAIIITAPLGTFGMDVTYKKLLHKE